MTADQSPSGFSLGGGEPPSFGLNSVSISQPVVARTRPVTRPGSTHCSQDVPGTKDVDITMANENGDQGRMEMNPR